MSAVELGAAKALYPFQGNHLTLPAGRMHYLDEGPRGAPVLLMLHGNPTWSFYYRDLVLAFRGEYRVIVPDHLGCGLSDKPEDFDYTLGNHIAHVEALVAHLGLTKLSVAVHDWGGAIGMGFAGRHPELVERLVVFNTAAFPSDQMPSSIALARVPGFGAFAIRGFNAFVRGALATCSKRPGRLTPAVRAGYLAPYHDWASRVATLRFVQDIPMGPGHRSWSVLSDVAARLSGLSDKPMLIVWGAQDFVFTDHFLEEWRRRFPAAEVHRIADAGHFVVEDAREEITTWMHDFLSRPPLAARS